MQLRTDTERAVDFYATSWISGDLMSARRMIAPNAEIEWNLELPVDDEQLVQTMHRLSGQATSVTVASHGYAASRAWLLYDCATQFGTARLAEFLAIERGRIAEIRQVHDPVAIRRYFPTLLEEDDATGIDGGKPR